MEPLIDSGPVLLDLDGGVARLRLNRPEASNGLNLALLQALFEALMRCHRDSRVRCLLLSGEGPNFCAGGDVREFAAQGERLPDHLREATTLLGASASALTHLEAPVVAMVHGYAAGGGGFGLVCASDMVIAAELARFLLGATRVGHGARRRGVGDPLPAGRSPPRAGDRAHQPHPDRGAGAGPRADHPGRGPTTGSPPRRADSPQDLAAGATRGLAAAKRLLWDGLGASMDARLAEECRTTSELSGTQDAREGLAAVLERRPPHFVGR